MNKVALVIIYNHQYNKNIEILESIYNARFSHIYHLVPFYNGTRTNVIPVYENSYYFQGYVAQGLTEYFDDDFAHYIFIGDDLLLNPVINEFNYAEHFRLSASACFLPDFIDLHEERNNVWPRVEEAVNYTINVGGVEAVGQLPDYNEALLRFKKFGLEIKPLRHDQIWKAPEKVSESDSKPVSTYLSLKQIKRKVKKLLSSGRMFLSKNTIDAQADLKNQTYNLSYPLVGSYSDIFIVSANSI